MKRSREVLFFNNEETAIDIIKYDAEDIVYFRDAYNTWVTLNDNLKNLGARRISIPNEFIEGIASYIMGYWKNDDIYHRFDCYDPKAGGKNNRIEVKYSARKSDISLFSPNINWDRINFVTLCANGVNDCKIEVYDISLDLIEEQSIELFDKLKNRNDGRRTILSIKEELIERKIYNDRVVFDLFAQ